MRLNRQDKIRLKHFLNNQYDRLEALINDYGADPADVKDITMIERVLSQLEKDLIK